MNKNTVFTILAVIGGLVVLGWVLRIAFSLVPLLIVAGLVVVGVFTVQKLLEKK